MPELKVESPSSRRSRDSLFASPSCTIPEEILEFPEAHFRSLDGYSPTPASIDRLDMDGNQEYVRQDAQKLLLIFNKT